MAAQPAPKPSDEQKRLASLRALGILDTPAEDARAALVSRLRSSPALRATRRKIRASFLAAGAVVGLIAGAALVLTNRFISDAQWVEHTHEVIAGLDEVRVRGREVESYARGYVISGTPAFVKSFETSRAELAGRLAELRRQTPDNPAQTARIAAMAALAEERVALATKAVVARRTKGQAVAMAIAGGAESREVGERLKIAAAEIRGVEKSLLTERREKTLATARRLSLAEGAGAIVALLLLLFVLRTFDRDTEARLVAQAEAERAQARLQAVFDAATSVAIMATGVDGVITIFNRGAERMLGWTSEELVGKARAALFHDAAEVTAAAESLEKTLGRPAKEGEVLTGTASTGSTESREWTFVRKDGGRLPVRLFMTAVRAEDGRLDGFIGIATDISDQRRAHEEMESALDLALRATQVKSEFLANMSHEIRTPMNAIIGMTGLLLDTALDARQRDYAGTVRSAGEALLVLINDVLDFSKIEAGKMRVESVPFDLRAAVEGAAELVAESASAKGLELIVDVPAAFPTGLRGDGGRVRQVLVNLLGNAIKFTETGEVVARVERREAAGEGVALRVSVSDTGIGIPEEVRRRLFQSFSQADASTRRKYGGTGLGLAISKQLVELMGGAIGVDSAPGKGSTFWFELSLPEAPEAAPAYTARAVLEGLRVLVVDDNAANREILREQLSSLGMSCSAVDGGEEALERLRGAAAGGKPYAVAVLDMNMPGMDGLTLARRVRAEPSVDGTKLVLLSSSAHTVGDAERADSGLSAFLTKPVRQAALFDCLGSVLAPSGRPAGRPAAAAPARSAAPRRFRVLIVDDNEVNRRIVSLQLEKICYASSTAAGGKEAISLLEREFFDLVFMDCQMPDLDGYETTRLLRANESSLKRRPVIVAMTAYALEGDREKCLEAGMDDYVAKPVRVEDLERVLARWDTPVKLDAVRDIREMAGAEYPKMLATFLAHTESHLTEAREAAANGDLARVRTIGHNLRGSCGTFGALPLSALCAELEERGKSGRAEGLNAALAELAAEFARVRSVLEAT